MVTINEQFKQPLIEAGFWYFDKADWEAFAGCTSPDPWILDSQEADLPVIILDGCNVSTFIPEGGESPFSNVFNVEFSDLQDAVNFAIVLSKQKTSWVDNQ